MRPIYVTRSLSVAADADGIALDQAIIDGNITLNGALVVDGVAQLGAQRKVLLTPGAGDDLTGINFTITGTTDQGQVISEVIAGPNAVTAQSVLDYSTVTSIEADAAGGAGESVSFGTNGVGASAPIPLDQYVPDFSVSLAVILRSGAANYTVQYTYDNVFDAYNTDPSQTPFMTGGSAGRPDLVVWWAHPDMTAQAANDQGVLESPVKAVRLLTNSGTGELEFQVVQGGTQ